MRYFFDFRDGDQLSIDPEGAEYGSRTQARAEAVGALAALVKDRLPDGDLHTFAIAMRDEDGQVIYTASLSLTGRWSG